MNNREGWNTILISPAHNGFVLTLKNYASGEERIEVYEYYYQVSNRLDEIYKKEPEEDY